MPYKKTDTQNTTLGNPPVPLRWRRCQHCNVNVKVRLTRQGVGSMQLWLRRPHVAIAAATATSCRTNSFWMVKFNPSGKHNDATVRPHPDVVSFTLDTRDRHPSHVPSDGKHPGHIDISDTSDTHLPDLWGDVVCRSTD